MTAWPVAVAYPANVEFMQNGTLQYIVTDQLLQDHANGEKIGKWRVHLFAVVLCTIDHRSVPELNQAGSISPYFLPPIVEVMKVIGGVKNPTAVAGRDTLDRIINNGQRKLEQGMIVLMFIANIQRILAML